MFFLAAMFLRAVPTSAGPVDQLKSFLNNDVPRFSQSYAQAELQKRWFDAYNALAVETVSVTSEIIRRLDGLTPSAGLEKFEIEQAVQSLVHLDDSLAYLTRAEARLQRLQTTANVLIHACEHSASHSTLAIRTAGLRAVAQVLVPPPNTDGLFLAWYSGADILLPLSFLYSYYRIVESHDERKRFQELAASYPQKVIQPAEILSLSIRICGEERTQHMPILREVQTHIAQIRFTVVQAQQRLRIAVGAIEAQLLPAAFADILANSGAQRRLLEAAQKTLASELFVDLEVASNRLVLAHSTAKQAGSCAAGISTVESYADQLASLSVQLSALEPYIHSPRVRTRLLALHADVNARQRGLDRLFLDSASRQCAN